MKKVLSLPACLSVLILLLAVLLLLCGGVAPTPATAAASLPAPGVGGEGMDLPSVQPPGWKPFRAGEVELWLPDTFVGGDTATEKQAVLDALSRLGPVYEQLGRAFEPQMSLYLLFAVDSIGDPSFDPARGGAVVLTTVGVQKQAVPAALPLDTYLDALVQALPSQVRVVQQEKVSLGGNEAARLVLGLTILGAPANELLYVIRGDQAMWLVMYATGADEFQQRLSTFEQSIGTLVVPGVAAAGGGGGPLYTPEGGFRPTGPLVPRVTTFIPTLLDVSSVSYVQPGPKSFLKSEF